MPGGCSGVTLATTPMLLARSSRLAEVLTAAPFAQAGQRGRRPLEVLDRPDGTEVEAGSNLGFEARDDGVSAWLGRLLDFEAARAAHESAAESLEEVKNAG